MNVMKYGFLGPFGFFRLSWKIGMVAILLPLLFVGVLCTATNEQVATSQLPRLAMWLFIYWLLSALFNLVIESERQPRRLS